MYPVWGNILSIIPRFEYIFKNSLSIVKTVYSHNAPHQSAVIWESTKPIPGPTSQSYEVGLFVTTQKERNGPYGTFHSY